MSIPKLTNGAIENIMSGKTCDHPVLQVLGQKKIPGTQGPDRYRLLLSDGVHSISSAMLATQLNDKVTSGQIDTNAIIRLDKYICNLIASDKRVMVLLEVSVLVTGSAVNSRIGNPQQFKGGSGGEPNAQSNNTSVDTSAPSRPDPPQPPARINNLMDINVTKPSNGFSASAQNQRPSGGMSSNSFFGTNQAPPRSTAAQMNRPSGSSYGAANNSADTPSKVHPIASLTPYQNRWTIKVRVSQKSAIRTWSNSRGEGQLFSMNLLDESGEIRATAFKSEVEKFYNLIEVNKVYYIRKATLKTANKQFSNLNNDYEMTFNSETEVVPCEDDIADLPSVNFNFIKINELEQHQPNTFVDVLGVAKEVDELKTIVTKATNKELKKRDVTLVDESQVQIRLTLWGNDAEAFDGSSHPVVAVKSCRLSDWGGRSLSLSGNSQMILNPDIPESHHLRGWFDSVGSTADYSEYKHDGGSGASSGSGTNWKTFAEVKAQNLGQEKADYFTAKGTVVFLKKENCMYQACPQQDCNKKVLDQGNGMFRCEKCNKEYPNFKWRLILSLNLADFTDNQWVSCFQDTAETILNKKADEIGHFKENDQAAFDLAFSEANFKSFIFKLRAKVENFNDENRMKTVCVQATPMNFVDYSHKLINDIEKMLGPV